MEWGLELGGRGQAGSKLPGPGACEHFPVHCGWVWTAGEVGKMSRYFGIISLLCAASFAISGDATAIKTRQGKL